MHQLETSSFQSGSFSRCTEFPCKSDCASIENRGTFTIFSVYPTERVEHAIGPLTSGLRHEHGRRHVGGHVGRSLFLRRHPSFLFSRFAVPRFSILFLLKFRKFARLRRIIYRNLYTNRVKRKVEKTVEIVRDKSRRSSVSALKFKKFSKSEASRTDLFAYNRVASLFSASFLFVVGNASLLNG